MPVLCEVYQTQILSLIIKSDMVVSTDMAADRRNSISNWVKFHVHVQKKEARRVLTMSDLIRNDRICVWQPTKCRRTVHAVFRG